ncbi:hypothetical protein HHK36_031156 [Tetracentron sinense]|uniref:Uncharacterized protein n=1 Tax=Tetracentron sinense TaxID=13715 RepID=A0A835D1F1_TETSI|nr:hypothetical protein HHK36_031156 [Tetracentron sinense]
MMQMEVDTKGVASPPPPPPLPPPLPRSWATAKPATKGITHSVTKQEIAQFWRQKHIEEEDHLLAALKAAARIRARNLTVRSDLLFMFSEEDYKHFEESLKDNHSKDEGHNNKEDDDNKELCVGIKDWWTKSKYAYLNQPAIESMDKPKRTSTYIPNFCFWKAPPPQPTSSLGVF